MAERLTVVVFDDAELARRLKVSAAECGVSQERLIEDAVRAYLGPEPAAGAKTFDWDAFDAWQQEVELREAGDEREYPDDLSDVKGYLYSAPEQPTRWRRVAEEPERYDAGK